MDDTSDGKICESGGYNELLSQQGAFSDLIEEFLIEEAKGRGRSVSFGEDGMRFYSKFAY